MLPHFLAIFPLPDLHWLHLGLQKLFQGLLTLTKLFLAPSGIETSACFSLFLGNFAPCSHIIHHFSHLLKRQMNREKNNVLWASRLTFGSRKSLEVEEFPRKGKKTS